MVYCITSSHEHPSSFSARRAVACIDLILIVRVVRRSVLAQRSGAEKLGTGMSAGEII